MEQSKNIGENLSKHERIMLKKQMGLIKDNRHNRKLEKFSDRFNKMFFFFLKSHRKGILQFAGVAVSVEFDPNGHSCRETFRRFDDGQYKDAEVSSRHNNIVKAVIQAKKAWGLWVKQWTEGIAECSFTTEEILGQFKDAGIEIPEPFLIEFNNALLRAKIARYERDFPNR